MTDPTRRVRLVTRTGELARTSNHVGAPDSRSRRRALGPDSGFFWNCFESAPDPIRLLRDRRLWALLWLVGASSGIIRVARAESETSAVASPPFPELVTEQGAAASLSMGSTADRTAVNTAVADARVPRIGLLRLDYDYLPIEGSADCSESRNAISRKVPGLTVEMAQSGAMTYEVQLEFAAAIRWLESKGVRSITGDCSFMAALSAIRPRRSSFDLCVLAMHSPLLSVSSAESGLTDGERGMWDKEGSSHERLRRIAESR